jgi:hypothetical protein
VEIELLFAINDGLVRNDERYRYLLPENYVLGDHDQLGERAEFDVFELLRGPVQTATILRGSGALVAVIPTWLKHANRFRTWVLADEIAVQTPTDDDEVTDRSNGRYREIEPWTFTGVELVSPILTAPQFTADGQIEPRGLFAVQKCLDLLNVPVTEPYWFGAGPDFTSVHVHIGLEPVPRVSRQVPIPLDVLRHVAWICVAYEDTIALLHHPERRGYHYTKSFAHAESNRGAFGDRRKGGGHHSCKPFDPLEAFVNIFKTRFDEGVDRRALWSLMCGRQDGQVFYHYRQTFVNFMNTNPDRQNGQDTVEFRQHHGTRDPDDICEWIVFVTALVRAAERKANEAAPALETVPLADEMVQEVDKRLPGQDIAAQKWTVEQMAKYYYLFSTPQRSLKELFDLLDLPVERRRYWWERAKKFAALSAACYQSVISCEPRSFEPPCTNPPVRDCLGWKDGELDQAPW